MIDKVSGVGSIPPLPEDFLLLTREFSQNVKSLGETLSEVMTSPTPDLEKLGRIIQNTYSSASKIPI